MIINAILPIFLMILCGYIIKKSSLVSKSFWYGVEQLTYYIFFPALLISKMSVTELSGIDLSQIIYIYIIALSTITLCCYGFRKLFQISHFSFGAFYQGAIRFNTYIGLSIINNLFGADGITIAIVIAAMLIPVVNICSVTILQIHQMQATDGRQKNMSQHLYHSIYNLIKNPLILGCLIGIVMNILNIRLPIALFTSIEILGSLALPLGLMAIGAALILNNLKDGLILIVLCSALKLLAFPLISLILALYFGLDPLTTKILVIFLALPTATASFILTKQMQSDYQLMARLITVETLFSGFTLLIILHFLNQTI